MTGAVFQPEQIELMRSVLGEATVMLPEAKQTSTVKADMASEILKCAAIHRCWDRPRFPLS